MVKIAHVGFSLVLLAALLPGAALARNDEGFDYAAFPIHQQGQLTIFPDDAADEGPSVLRGADSHEPRRKPCVIVG